MATHVNPDTKLHINKCPCGHPYCSEYHIREFGMVQGGGLDLETAERVVALWNDANEPRQVPPHRSGGGGAAPQRRQGDD